MWIAVSEPCANSYSLPSLLGYSQIIVLSALWYVCHSVYAMYDYRGLIVLL